MTAHVRGIAAGGATLLIIGLIAGAGLVLTTTYLNGGFSQRTVVLTSTSVSTSVSTSLSTSVSTSTVLSTTTVSAFVTTIYTQTVTISSEVSTSTLSSAPSQATSVTLSIVPPTLPSDGGVYPAVFVSLVDAASLPAIATGNVTVFLASSAPNIAQVPESVTINAGQEYTVAKVTTTTTPGLALITAHAEGLTSPSPVALSTVTPSGFPSKLVVYTSPSVFLPGAGTGVLRVEVVDDAGFPSKAISAIPVSLFTSNSSVASPGQSSLTIAAGSIIADGTVQTSEPGSAVISAVSSGYTAGVGLVTVNEPGQSEQAYRLAMRVVPGVLPTDGQTYPALEVDLETLAGSPAVSGSDTTVQLTSDNPAVASVQSLVVIPAGSTSALASISTSALAGVANVTAVATGLIPTTISVRTVIPAPTNLSMYVAPSLASSCPGLISPTVVVQLQDSAGNPSIARQTTEIVVSSSGGGSPLMLMVPAGSDYAYAPLSGVGAGSVTLTASSQGLGSAQTTLQEVSCAG